MRRERVMMVQTEPQYICIYQCVLAALLQRDEYSPKEVHDNPGFEGKFDFFSISCKVVLCLLCK